MNCLTGASYLRDSTTGWVSKTWFGESGYGYDQNGNITGLNRNSYNGTVSLMDALSYSYNSLSNEKVATIGHELEHDLNKPDIAAIKDRQEGRSNTRNVENAASEVEDKIRSEIENR